jgi:hypothetical protein
MSNLARSLARSVARPLCATLLLAGASSDAGYQATADVIDLTLFK